MLKLLLVGMILALTSGFGVIAWISLRPAPPALQAGELPVPPVRVTVLVASRPVRAGSLVKPEDIGTLDLPGTEVPEGARIDSVVNRSDLIGAMARRTLAAQQPMLLADVLRPIEGGFLAAVLAPNHRAVSVAVDAVSGTAGLIWPGDRVDLILTQALDEQSVPVGRRTFGETVLRDVRVIAIDQQLARGVTPEAAAAANRTVTLEVLPEAAERVAVATRLGKLALTVRAADAARPSDAGSVGADAPSPLALGAAAGATASPQPALAAATASPTTWGQDVSPALGARSGPSAGSSVRVFQGAVNEKEFKFP